MFTFLPQAPPPCFSIVTPWLLNMERKAEKRFTSLKET